MGRTASNSIISTKSKPKFQETIIGIIVLGLVGSAIWYFIQPNKENSQNITNANISNSKIIQGDIVQGNKIVSPITDSNKENNREYVFINNFCAITAITDKDDKVMAYSITTLDSNFTPNISLANADLKFKLGITTFKEIEKTLYEPGINGTFGENWFHYNEEYYLGLSGNYQTYIFSVNENGFLNKYFYDNPPFFLHEELNDQKNEDMDNFRANVPPNTITITSSFFNTNETFKEYKYGPSQTQTRLLSTNQIKKITEQNVLEKIQKLYPESNIKLFIENFGEPNFVNAIEK